MTYSNARMNFYSMDALIEYINERYHYNTTVMYSTPGEYLKAIIALNQTWPTRYFDMVPYADAPEDYWSGMYSSRPNLKKFVRDATASLMASQKLNSLKVIHVNATDDDIKDILAAKE